MLGVAAGVVYAFSGYVRNRVAAEKLSRKMAEGKVPELREVFMLGTELARLQPRLLLEAAIYGLLIGVVVAATGLELDVTATFLTEVGILTLVRKLVNTLTNVFTK